MESNYNRASELRAFDDTKSGVKGLVDAGIDRIPRIFYQLLDNLDKTPFSGDGQYSFPVLDLEGVDENPIQRKKIVERVRNASETWGFFQVINNGIPGSVLEEVKDGVRRFNEQDVEVRRKFYTRDHTKRVIYNSNFLLYRSPPANWRDTMACIMAPSPPKAEELPAVCGDIIKEYTKQVKKLGDLLFELLEIQVCAMVYQLAKRQQITCIKVSERASNFRVTFPGIKECSSSKHEDTHHQ